MRATTNVIMLVIRTTTLLCARVILSSIILHVRCSGIIQLYVKFICKREYVEILISIVQLH